jgi:nitrous oxidase accessory protein NosD
VIKQAGNYEFFGRPGITIGPPAPPTAFKPAPGGNGSNGHAHGNCMVVRASNVNLDIEFGGFEGDGTGIGIHVLPGAANFSFNSFAASITNFRIAFLINAPGAHVGASTGDEPLQLSATSAGIVVANTYDAEVSSAAITAPVCISLQRVKHSTVLLTEGQFGWLSGCNIGVSLVGSSFSTIQGGPQYENTPMSLSAKSYGILIGRGSNFNTITQVNVQNSGIGVQISKGAGHNTVNSNVSVGNGVSLLDQNRGCGSNTWSNNTYNTANPPDCIH